MTVEPGSSSRGRPPPWAPDLATAQEKKHEVELADILCAVVMARSEVPADARTATSLGTQRVGSGGVIDAEGLVLIIGHLILEAARTKLIVASGDAVEATVVG